MSNTKKVTRALSRVVTSGPDTPPEKLESALETVLHWQQKYTRTEPIKIKEDIYQENIDKLKARHFEKYTIYKENGINALAIYTVDKTRKLSEPHKILLNSCIFINNFTNNHYLELIQPYLVFLKLMDQFIKIEGKPNLFSTLIDAILSKGITLEVLEFFLSLITLLMMIDLDPNYQNEYNDKGELKKVGNPLNLLFIHPEKKHYNPIKMIKRYVSQRITSEAKKSVIELLETVFTDKSRYEQCKGEILAGKMTFAKLLVYFVEDIKYIIPGLSAMSFGIFGDLFNDVKSGNVYSHPQKGGALSTIMLPFVLINNFVDLLFKRSVIIRTVTEACSNFFLKLTITFTNKMLTTEDFTYEDLNIDAPENIKHIIETDDYPYLKLFLQTMKINDYLTPIDKTNIIDSFGKPSKMYPFNIALEFLKINVGNMKLSYTFGGTFSLIYFLTKSLVPSMNIENVFDTIVKTQNQTTDSLYFTDRVCKSFLQILYNCFTLSTKKELKPLFFKCIVFINLYMIGTECLKYSNTYNDNTKSLLNDMCVEFCDNIVKPDYHLFNDYIMFAMYGGPDPTTRKDLFRQCINYYYYFTMKNMKDETIRSVLDRYDLQRSNFKGLIVKEIDIISLFIVGLFEYSLYMDIYVMRDIFEYNIVNSLFVSEYSKPFIDNYIVSQNKSILMPDDRIAFIEL